jgi:hypothetical protein
MEYLCSFIHLVNTECLLWAWHIQPSEQNQAEVRQVRDPGPGTPVTAQMSFLSPNELQLLVLVLAGERERKRESILALSKFSALLGLPV